MDPELIVDGEMQVDTALEPGIMEEFFPFSKLQGEANVLVFPNLASANIAYKLLKHFAGARSLGPILMGLDRPVAVLQKGFDVEDVITLSAITVHDAQQRIQGCRARRVGLNRNQRSRSVQRSHPSNVGFGMRKAEGVNSRCVQ